ncbi:MAG: hypothetical protein FMNOHCHN_02161 [Ignavibacteriaceae bacterium]|nr:hypothetical protein [Ignavibacteriaceae bacterium]
MGTIKEFTHISLQQLEMNFISILSITIIIAYYGSNITITQKKQMKL